MRKLFTRAAPAAVAATVMLTFTAASAVSSDTYESQVISRTNHHRVAHDKVAVKAQSCADRWAEGQATWMAKHKSLKHRSGRLGKIMDDCGFSSASENIAMGYSSGNKTVEAWMKSSGHRANILRTRSRFVGVGAVQDNTGAWWVAEVFGSK